MLSENEIRPDPKKVQAIKKKEAPTNDKEVRAFIGMCSYFRRHIQNFAKIADPLYKITDASFQGLGTVLLQVDNLIAFARRGLKVAEKNYEIMRLEGIEILFALKIFRPYIYGLRTTIITYHKPLLALLRKKELKNALQRLQTAIMKYDLEIIYQPEFEKYYTNTERKLLHSSNTVKTQHGKRYLIPETIKEHLLKQYHEHPWLGDYYGYEKNIQKFKQIYYWKTLEENAEKIWKECIKCMKNKPQPYFQLKNSLGKLPTADYPCQSYSVDIITVTDGLHYILGCII
uniref:RNA-directed DNA polymerase n=1 Tax=Strongyloides venezuelensis TaxID=75913 RepID=A0A0K0FS03_STRVS